MDKDKQVEIHAEITEVTFCWLKKEIFPPESFNKYILQHMVNISYSTHTHS